MTEIVYDVNGLTIDVYYDKIDHSLKWSIQNTEDKTPIFNAAQIKTIIFQLEKSLAVDAEVKFD